MNLIKKIISRYNDPLYRNSHYLMINTLLSSFIGFIFWIIVTKYYDTYDVGLATALISVSTMISIFSTFGLDSSMVRFLANEKEKIKYINTSLTIITIISIFLSVIFLIGINLWTPSLNYINDSVFYISLFLIYNVTSALFVIVSYVFIALRDSKYVLIQSILLNLLRIPLPLFLIFLSTGFGIYASYSISMMITILISLFIILKEVLPNYWPSIHFDKDIFKKISHFSAGNFVSTVFGSLPPLIIPLIILAFLSPVYNAYFYMVYTIAGALLVVPVATASSLFAEGSFNQDMFLINLKKSLKQTYLIIIPSVILLLLFGDKILLIFGKSYSAEGSLLLYLFAISTIFISLNTIYVAYLRVNMNIKKIMLITPINSTLILIISFILIPKLGIVGAGFAYLISSALVSAYVILSTIPFILNRRKFNKNRNDI